jgi:cyclophilin family peptidyl-prolyl cis-trans isomerase/uncharacterized protein YegP (UPF0339 family)
MLEDRTAPAGDLQSHAMQTYATAMFWPQLSEHFAWLALPNARSFVKSYFTGVYRYAQDTIALVNQNSGTPGGDFIKGLAQTNASVALAVGNWLGFDVRGPRSAPPSSPPPPPANTLTLGNRVFNDANNNGQLDTGESGVSGVLVELLDSAGNPISGRTTTTSANGTYTFTGLAAGIYRVRLAASNFNTGGALASFTASGTTASNPNDNIDNDNNGSVSGTLGSGGFIVSAAIDLALNSEPTNDGDTDANTNLTLDFGVVSTTPGNTLTLGNLVYRDNNNNGTFDTGDVGIDGVSVQLVSSGGAVINTTTTAGGGLYTFSNLAAGDYRVRLAATNFNTGAVLAGFTASPNPVADPDNDVDNDSNGVTSGTLGSGGFIESGLITLAANGEPTNDGDSNANTNLTLDLGLVPPAPAGPLTLGNLVYRDNNNNGTFDTGDVGIDGVAVELLNAQDTVVGSTTTAGGGLYTFTGLAAGDYHVRLTAANFNTGGVLAGFTAAPNSVADPDNDADNDNNSVTSGTLGSGGFIDSGLITLADGLEPINDGDTNADTNLSLDFGVVGPAPAGPLTLGNLVYRDNNNNGTFDTGDVGIDGVSVELLDANHASLGTTTTAGGGLYTFTGLAAGDYHVRLVATNFNTGGVLAGFTAGANPVADPDNDADNDNNASATEGTLGSGGHIESGLITLAENGEPINDGDTSDNTNLTLDFALAPPAPAGPLTLGNLVYRDNNNNGTFDTGDVGIDGVAVNVLNSQDVVVGSTTTAGGGLYTFTGLAAGDYHVHLVASNFNTGGVLAGFTAGPNSVADPDNDADNDNNGITNGTLGSGGFIGSGIITLAENGEPINDGDTSDNTNLTLDFALLPPAGSGGPTVPTLGLDAASDTGTQGDNTTDLATVTLVGTTSPNVSVELTQTGATTTSDGSGNFSFTNVALVAGDNPFTVEATDPSGTTSFSTTITRNAAPTVVDPLDPVSLAASASLTVDVAGTFDDADITNTVVQFDTSSGDINVELFDRQAPKTVANFLNYVNDGDYTDSIFHRSVNNFVIQGGGFTFEPTPTPSLAEVPEDPAVLNEPDAVNRSNLRGTLAMAKLPSGPDTATSQFFFNLANNTGLDTQNGGFTVFGEVVGAPDQAVVDAIAAIPTQDQGAAADLPPSQQGVFDEIPLVNYTGTDFPTDTIRDNYAIINGISIVSQTEVLTYSIQNNSDPTVATATMTDNRLSIQGLQAGQTTLTIRATDQSGSFVDTTLTVTVT